jgi:hypothetical protein
MSEAQNAAQSRVVLDIQNSYVRPDITLVVGDAKIPAHSGILHVFSSCAAGLPQPCQEWDLTHLRIGDDAKPPSVSTVLAWLEWLYWTPSRPHSPSNIVDALPLLQFADAVGTNLSILEAIAKSYEWAVRVPEPGTFGLPVKLVIDSSSCYQIWNASNRHQHQQHASFSFGGQEPAVPEHLIIRSVGSGLAGLKSLAGALVERLLHIALQTHLTELFEAIETWVRLHMGVPDSLFYGMHQDIFSPRVMQGLGTDRLAAKYLKWVSKT